MVKWLFLLCALLLTGAAHTQQIDDPANLMGERVSAQDPADTLPINHGAAALQQLLLKLRTRASLMLIVAHPDDEDGGMLTYESRGQGARVAMLTLTRGEGGQNLMSSDFDDALGLIRTQELLAADRYFGVDQFFGTEIDFGFSKTKEESFAKWTHERVLYDAVRAVRLYRPLVIASVFVGGPTDGHGQHQVSGEIAQEVFVAAADPKVFPEMKLPPWAALKVYARVPFSRVTAEGMYDYATGRTVPTRFHNYVTGRDSSTVPVATVQVHEGDKPRDPTLAAAMGGDSYIQFARKGLALQKTQIGANVRLAPAGAFDSGYTLMGSRINCPPGPVSRSGCGVLSSPGREGGLSNKTLEEKSLFDGIDTSLTSLATIAPAIPGLSDSLTKIAARIAEATLRFDPEHLELIVSPLHNALEELDAVLGRIGPITQSSPAGILEVLHDLRIKRVECNDALVRALDIEAEAIAESDTGDFIPGATALVRTRITHKSVRPLALTRSELSFNTAYFRDPPAPRPLPELLTGEYTQRVPNYHADLPITRPYFRRTSAKQAYYDLDNFVNPLYRNAPATPSPLNFWVEVKLDGVALEIRKVVVTEPISLTKEASLTGHSVRPFAVVPVASLQVLPSTGIYPLDAGSITITSKLDIKTLPSKVSIAPLLPTTSWTAAPPRVNILLAGPDRGTDFSFQVNPPATRASGIFSIPMQATVGDYPISEGYKQVGYPGLTYTNFYTAATYRAVAIDLHAVPSLRVAYVPGTGDRVPDFLPNLGIAPTILDVDKLTANDLKQYDAVMLGVRAYAAHPELGGAGSSALIQYARAGGVVIVQYNTARYGDAEAPLPISVPGDSAHNVVEEAQPVRILVSDAPLLNWPNKITAADFDGWVAERGHGFAADWDPGYTALTETHDEGQDPQRGGLLYARTGKGAYVYLAYALYRQLPEGVPGAYRLMANLLSLGKNPGLAR